jgi:hypothetical protein
VNKRLDDDDLSVTQITKTDLAHERDPRSLQLPSVRSGEPLLRQAKGMTKMTKTELNTEILSDDELDGVTGGEISVGGCCGPWRLPNGTITTHQPAGPNPWLPGGVFHG